MAALGYPGAKIFLKEDDVPTLFPVVEAMLMPSIGRTQAATRASMTTVHLGSNELSARILVMLAHSEFGQYSLEISAHNFGDFSLRAQWA